MLSRNNERLCSANTSGGDNCVQNKMPAIISLDEKRNCVVFAIIWRCYLSATARRQELWTQCQNRNSLLLKPSSLKDRTYKSGKLGQRNKVLALAPTITVYQSPGLWEYKNELSWFAHFQTWLLPNSFKNSMKFINLWQIPSKQTNLHPQLKFINGNVTRIQSNETVSRSKHIAPWIWPLRCALPTTF
jgi:hypothetical protein